MEEDIELPETDETGDEAKGEEVTSTEVKDLTGIRKMFEVDSDEEEEEEADYDAEDPQRAGVGDNGGFKSKEERGTGTNETADEHIEYQLSERPEVEGLCGVDKRGGAFVINHGYKTEEKLYNHLVRYGKVLDIVNEDGSEIEDPDNLPQTVVVEFENAENEDSTLREQQQQKWKVLNNYFENVTLKQRGEGVDRWDICGDENILEMMENHVQFMILMKSSVEENEYYSKVTTVYYRGQKVVSCEKGKLCLIKVTEDKVIRIPGRLERSKNYHTTKCIEMKDIQIIETK